MSEISITVLEPQLSRVRINLGLLGNQIRTTRQEIQHWMSYRKALRYQLIATGYDIFANPVEAHMKDYSCDDPTHGLTAEQLGFIHGLLTVDSKFLDDLTEHHMRWEYPIWMRLKQEETKLQNQLKNLEEKNAK